MVLDRAFNLLADLNECEEGVKLYDCTKYTYTAYANIQVLSSLLMTILMY